MFELILAVLAVSVIAVVGAVIFWDRVSPETSHRSAWLAAAVAAGLGVVGLVEPATDVVRFDWVPLLGLGFEFTLDSFAALFLIILGGVGAVVFAFTVRYQRGKSGSGRFIATMLAFAASMAGLVLSSDVFTLFVFWEATTFTSYLLIGHHHQTSTARRSARQAALVTGAGGLAMLAGLILLADEAGSSSIDAIVAAAPTGTAAWVLVLIGAMTKSAQFPFSSWLPAAMAAPTPASAFLHSATMVKAGIVLVGRLSPGAADVDWWIPAVVAIGLVTMLIGAVRAIRQHDLKLILAFGTVSALGLMFASIGTGTPTLVVGGIALLVAHAIYKSTLFLTVGVIEAQEKTRDIRKLGHVGRSNPLLAVVAVVGAASMAGVPLTLGFASKEVDLDAFLDESVLFGWIVALLSALTVAYSVRFAASLFRERAKEGSMSSPAFLWPIIFLAVVGTVFGLLPGLLTTVEADAAAALVGVVEPPKLVVWPGLVPAFGLSMLGLVCGLAVGWWSLRRSGAGESRTHRFDNGIERMQRVASRVTALIQNGSLPVYLGQILVVAVVVPLPALVRGGAVPLPPAGGVIEWVVVAFLVSASLALLRVRRRMSAVLLLGAVGYSMSALFALAGAPDVAITQVLVETLVVTLFALALRLLPLEFSGERGFVPWKGLVAVLVGGFAVLVTLVAGSVESSSAVSDAQLNLAVPEAAGANVVNVTLVDFRALDTLGEIAVLGIAALGVMALVRPLGGVVASRAFVVRPSPILERGASIINPLLLVFALYLLLAGHNQPGGGFAAGLVASGWLVIVWLTSGASGVRKALRVEPSVLIGVGLAAAVVTGLGGFAWADGFLASNSWAIDAGPLGQIKFVTPLLFDIGVAITVLGSVAGAVRGLEAA